MKRHIIVAALLGTCISILLAVIEATATNIISEYLTAPGIIVVFILWGHGGAIPSIVISLTVIGINLIIYGLVILALLNLLERYRTNSSV